MKYCNNNLDNDELKVSIIMTHLNKGKRLNIYYKQLKELLSKYLNDCIISVGNTYLYLHYTFCRHY